MDVIQLEHKCSPGAHRDLIQGSNNGPEQLLSVRFWNKKGRLRLFHRCADNVCLEHGCPGRSGDIGRVVEDLPGMSHSPENI